MKVDTLMGPKLDTLGPATGQLVIQILASLGEFECKLIRSRVEDGTSRARERGVKFGRKPKLNQYQRQQALLRLAHGETQAGCDTLRPC